MEQFVPRSDVAPDNRGRWPPIGSISPLLSIQGSRETRPPTEPRRVRQVTSAAPVSGHCCHSSIRPAHRGPRRGRVAGRRPRPLCLCLGVSASISRSSCTRDPGSRPSSPLPPATPPGMITPSRPPLQPLGACPCERWGWSRQDVGTGPSLQLQAALGSPDFPRLPKPGHRARS